MTPPTDTGETANPEARALLAAHDWATTPLGPRQAWPTALRAAVELMLDSAQPVYIGWGAELVSLYNDGVIPFVGGRHPASFGKPYRAVWPQLWAEFRPVFDAIFAGRSRAFVDQPLALAGRPGRSTSWLSFTITPLRDDAGVVRGFYCAALETTERVLAERETRQTYRALFESIEEGFCVIEMLFDAQGKAVDYILLETNPAYVRHTGLVDVEGRRASEVAPMLEPFWFETYGRIARTGRSERFEHGARPIGRWFNVHAFRVGEPDQHRVAVIFDDITRDKQLMQAERDRQARQAYELALSDALRPLGDPAAVRQTAAAVLGRHLRANRVAYAEDMGDAAHFRVYPNYVDGAADLSGQFRYADYGDGLRAQLLAGRDLVQPDLAHDPALDADQRRAFAQLGIGASMNVPLVKDGRLLAFIGVNFNAAHDFTAEEIALTRLTAERTWAAVEHASAATVLRDSEARLAAAFESVPAGIAAFDTAGRTIVANAEYQRYIPGGLIPSRDPASLNHWRGWDAAGRPLAPHDFPGARALRGERMMPGQEMLHVDDLGREIWTEVTTAPIWDTAGKVTGAVTVISDISGRRRMLDALRRSEERLRQFGDASQDVLWIRDAASLQWQYLTPAFETLYGVTREAALADNDYRSWLALIVPEDQPRAMAMMDRVRAGEQVAFEYRIRRPSDGSVRWVRSTDFPIFDAEGAITLIGGIGHDMTELRETGQRLTALVEGIPQLVWRAGADGVWTWVSPQWATFTGQSPRDSLGWGWLSTVHPDDRATARDAWHEASKLGGLSAEYRLRSGEDGSWRWFQSRAVPVRDEAGAIVEWLGTSTDVDDMRRLQNQQTVLVAELQHRTFNLLGLVQSMAETTRRSSQGLEDFLTKFNSRLAALARAQRLLSRAGVGTLDELVRGELDAFGALEDARVQLVGPAGIVLSPDSVQILAMALHELTTNAVKHGALRHAGARLSIRWRVEAASDARRLHLEWRETGVDMTALQVQGTGQGRVLIEQALPYQLSARTTFALTGDGVHCTIDVPLGSRAPG